MIVLGEHTFPDRFRLRPVHFGGELYVMYAGAQLGGRCPVDTPMGSCEPRCGAAECEDAARALGPGAGRAVLPPLWRWLACQRLHPPLEEQVNGWRKAVGGDGGEFSRACWRSLIATYGIRWGEVSAGTAGWQLARVDGLPEWLEERLFSGAWDEDRMDRLRRSIVSEDVTKMRSAMAAVAMYEDRALEGLAVLDG